MDPNIKRTDSRARHAELYSAPHGEAAEDEVSTLLTTLVYLLKPDHVLEVGTGYGHTAERIAKALAANGLGQLHTVEANQERAAAAVHRLRHYGNARLFQMRYQQVEPFVPYQLAFFDAKWNERYQEFRHFQEVLPAGAVLVFHDTGDASPGRPGVDRLEGEGLIKSIFLPTPRGISLATVT